MKRIALVIALLLALVCPASAGFLDFCIGWGEKTVDTLIVTVTSVDVFIVSLEVNTDGTNDAKVILYDSLTATGPVITEVTINGGSHFGGRTWEIPRKITTGIYGDIVTEGVGASFIVETGTR